MGMSVCLLAIATFTHPSSTGAPAIKITLLSFTLLRLYTPGPFYAAKLTTTLPFNILIALLFSWVGYGMFGYRNSALALVQVCVWNLLLVRLCLFT